MPLINHVHTLVIGAGPSGLSLAYHLQGDTLLLEKEDRVGGLCRSFRINNGVFDIGGHCFHTPFPEVKELVASLMQGELEEFQRDARVFSNGVLIPYPFQKHFEQIPDREVVEACLAGLKTAEPNPVAKNYEDFILSKFGAGIAKQFMLPYNRKLWGPNLKRLSADWASERVAGSKNEVEQYKTTSGKRTPLQSYSLVSYPSRGGFEEIFKRMAEQVPAVKCNQTITRIIPGHKIVETADGIRYKWDQLVSTIPLPELLKIIDSTPTEIIELGDQLEYLPLRVELLLVGRQMPGAPHRAYVADQKIPAHKIAFNHTSSKYLMSLPQHAIMAEVSFANGKFVQRETIAQLTIDALIDMNLFLSQTEVIWQGAIEVKYGYPVYTHPRPYIIGEIKRYLEVLDIHTLGRFGEWEYINSDHCIRKGKKLARQLEIGA